MVVQGCPKGPLLRQRTLGTLTGPFPEAVEDRSSSFHAQSNKTAVARKQGIKIAKQCLKYTPHSLVAPRDRQIFLEIAQRFIR